MEGKSRESGREGVVENTESREGESEVVEKVGREGVGEKEGGEDRDRWRLLRR